MSDLGSESAMTEPCFKKHVFHAPRKNWSGGVDFYRPRTSGLYPSTARPSNILSTTTFGGNFRSFSIENLLEFDHFEIVLLGLQVTEGQNLLLMQISKGLRLLQVGSGRSG